MKSLRNLATIVGSIVALSLGGCAEEKEYPAEQGIIEAKYRGKLETKSNEYIDNLRQARSSLFDYCTTNQTWNSGKDLASENDIKFLEANRNALNAVLKGCNQLLSSDNSSANSIDDSENVASTRYVVEEKCIEAEQEYGQMVEQLCVLTPDETFKKCYKLDKDAEKTIEMDFMDCRQTATADRRDTYGGQRSAWNRDYARQDFEKYCASPISKVKVLEACVAKLRGH